MPTRAQDLVIFDCDGVLVDSETISIDVLVRAIESAGGTIDIQGAYDQFLGRSLTTVIETLKADYELPVGDDFLEHMRRDLYIRFHDELKPVTGVSAMLGHAGWPFCVASSSQLERIRLSLEITGLLNYFEPNIFSATMVARGKPAPDLFLHAASTMGFAPSRCVVVEDSPAGIVAAHAAGMRVFAFVGASHAEKSNLRKSVEALKPALIFDDIRMLPDLLAELDN